MKRRTPGRVHAVTLLLYTVLSLLLSWPLLARLSTHVPGVPQWAFDESTFVWNIWYFKHALVDNLSSPLHTELIWYPLGIDLVLYTYNFFHALIAQPLMLAFNLPVASNLALLFSTVMSGYGTFLLVRYVLGRGRLGDRETGRLGARTGERSSRQSPNLSQSLPPSILIPAFLAGLLYAFASNRAIYAALGHYDMVTTQWIPFYALMLLRMLDGALSPAQRRKAALVGGFFFALNGLAEMITAVFLAMFTVIVLVDYGLRIWTTYRIDESRLKIGETERSAQQPMSIVTRQSSVGSPPANLQSSILNLALLGAVAFLLWAPVLVPILVQFLTDDFALKGWGEAIPLSTDLLGWFTPTVLHPLFGSDLVAELRRVQLRALEQGVTGFRDINTVFIGWTALALALVGAFTYRRRARVWIWTAVIFGLFTLGPFLQINGVYRFDLDGVEATFPMPYALLHYIPIIKANRAPNRNSVMLMLAVAVLAGYGVMWLMARLKGRNSRSKIGASEAAARRHSSIFSLQSLLVILLALLLLFEHLAVPAPLSDARVPAVYAEIAADPRPVSVMQVPLGWRNSFGVLGPERTQLQYFQTGHGKPMLGGNISRAPDFKMEYFARIPYFDALTQIEFGNEPAPEVRAAAVAQADDLMYLYNTEYVLLYPPIPQRFPYADHWQAAWDFVKTTLPLEDEPFWAQDGIEAYRVVQPQGSDSFTVDLGETGTFPYRGEGWDSAETDLPYETPAVWGLDEVSRLFVPLRGVDAARDYTVTVRLRPFAYPGAPEQRVAAVVNGRELAAHALVEDWQEVTWTVPGEALLDGLNRVELHWAHAVAPRDVLGGSRAIGTTGVEMPVDADIKAFADGAFIALFDEDGTQADASAGRRGVNVTVLEPASGAVVAQVGFDTEANAFESVALAEFLDGVPSGQIVVLATNGDATAFLGDDAQQQFATIGFDAGLDVLSGNHFAVIGVKGAAPGSAAAVIHPDDAFLRVSLNRDRRPLAAAVDWLRVE